MIKKQTILTFLATVLFSVLLHGCVTVRSLPPVTHNLPSIAPVNFTFPSQNNDGEEISDSAIIGVIKQAMVSHYPPKGLSSDVFSGKVWDGKRKGEILVQYKKGVRGEGYAFVSALDATWQIKITTSGNQKHVVVNPPSSLLEEVVENPLTKTLYKFSIPKAEKDVKELRALLASLNPTIHFAKVKPIKGEINVKYSDESVYANFTRMMGSYSFSNEEEAKGYDITKDHVFALKHKDKLIPLKMTVYPYREGSKVVYEFEYRYSMTVSGKTGSSISSYSQSELDALMAEVSRVAND